VESESVKGAGGVQYDVDPDLESAEREGKLLARIAEQEREIERLRARLERAETALANTLEQLAVTAIHESRTNPPPPPIASETHEAPTAPPLAAITSLPANPVAIDDSPTEPPLAASAALPSDLFAAGAAGGDPTEPPTESDATDRGWT
jgi:hypothetical protein